MHRRRTVTEHLDTRNSGVPDGWSRRQRNLGANLGGCIFGCTKDTYDECVQGGVFGLPRRHEQYVKHVQPGMPIFLFNYTDRKMHGIFKAVSAGGLFNRHGWTGSPAVSTLYPAQVRVEVHHQFPPLYERDYKPILKDSYPWDGERDVLVFELTKRQCAALCRRFADAAGVPAPPPTRPQPRPAGTPAPPPTRSQPRAAASAAPAARPQPQPRPATSASTVARPQPQPRAATSAAAAEPEAPTRPTPDEDGFTLVVSKKKRAPPAGPSGNAWGGKAGGLATIAEGAPHEVLPEEDAFGGIQNVPDQTQHHAACFAQEADGVGTGLASPREDISAVYAETPEGLVDSVEFKQQRAQELYLIGGDYGISTDTSERMTVVESFSTLSHSMRVGILDEHARRTNGAAAALGPKIYISGGTFEDRDWLASGLGFNVETKKYFKIADMKHPRGGFDAVTLGDKIYVVGGAGPGGLYHNHGEYYDPAVDLWSGLPKMSKRRFNCTVETMNGSLYCVGGFDGGAYLTTVERYDPQEPQGWQQVAPISTRRGAHACEVLGSRMYIMGGYGGSMGFLSNTEVYDPVANAWTPGPDMEIPRAFGNSGVLDGQLYVLCGVTAFSKPQGVMLTEYNHTVQRLDVGEDCWKLDGWPNSDYSTGRAYGVAVVL